VQARARHAATGDRNARAATYKRAQAAPLVYPVPDAGGHPNDLEDAASARLWIGHSEYYDAGEYAHLQFFSSIDELFAKIQSTDWRAVRTHTRT
jgi:hypothetical protein